MYTVAQGREKPTDSCSVPLLATANAANYQTTRALEVSNKNDGLQKDVSGAKAIYLMKNKYGKQGNAQQLSRARSVCKQTTRQPTAAILD